MGASAPGRGRAQRSDELMFLYGEPSEQGKEDPEINSEQVGLKVLVKMMTAMHQQP